MFFVSFTKKKYMRSIVSLGAIFSFFSLGANFEFRKVILVTAILCLCTLYAVASRNKLRSNYYILLPPFLFISLVLVTPGQFFIDARIAGRIACAFVFGLTVKLLFDNQKGNLISYTAIGLLTGGVYALCANYLLGFSITVPIDRLILQFYHPHELALVSVFCLISTICYFNKCNKWAQWILFCAIPFELLFIFFSVSRSSWIGLTLVVLVSVIRYRHFYLLKGAAVVLLCAFFLFPALPQSGQGRIKTMLNIEPTKDMTVQMRLGIWKSAIAGIKKAPLLGNGLRTFTDHDIKYRLENFEELKKIPFIWLNKTKRWAHPHNLLLGLIYGWGIIGGLFFIWCFIQGLKISHGSDNMYLFLMFIFNIGYGIAELKIKGFDGAFFLFFPLGVAYGELFFKKNSHYTTKTSNWNAESPLVS